MFVIIPIILCIIPKNFQLHLHHPISILFNVFSCLFTKWNQKSLKHVTTKISIEELARTYTVHCTDVFYCKKKYTYWCTSVSCSPNRVVFHFVEEKSANREIIRPENFGKQNHQQEMLLLPRTNRVWWGSDIRICTCPHTHTRNTHATHTHTPTKPPTHNDTQIHTLTPKTERRDTHTTIQAACQINTIFPSTTLSFSLSSSYMLRSSVLNFMLIAEEQFDCKSPWGWSHYKDSLTGKEWSATDMASNQSHLKRTILQQWFRNGRLCSRDLHSFLISIGAACVSCHRLKIAPLKMHVWLLIQP